MSPRDVSDLESDPTAVRPQQDTNGSTASFVITVAEGPDCGRELTLDTNIDARALLGQSPACELQLTDRQVSRRHGVLEIVGQRLRLKDLGSTNGTFVDGVCIGEAYLLGGETVRLGGTALHVTRRAGSSPGDHVHRSAFGRLFGASAEMRRLYPVLERLAQSNVPVVIEGETGTGKEVLAEALHEASPRASGAFVVFDCTAVAPNLVESEMFGHERGAFTGAVSARKGVFEQAQGGTLLIDEIGDLDPTLQPKLLRAIERSEIRRVGADRPLRIDVRVLAATRRDLDRAVEQGRFRDDLFHRLAVGRVELPPLRLRRGDITRLARHFWIELGGRPDQLSSELLQAWEEAPWPGNVRQLRNTIARKLALGDLAAEIEQSASPSPQSSASDVFANVIAQKLPLPVARMRIVEEFERQYIADVLADHNGNVVHAAKASGIARRYFQILRSGRRR